MKQGYIFAISFVLFLAVDASETDKVRTKRQAPSINVHSIPKTSFTCVEKKVGDYYADPETECQVYHVCIPGMHNKLSLISFVCPNGTIFSQATKVCTPYERVDCSLTTNFIAIYDRSVQLQEKRPVPENRPNYIPDNRSFRPPESISQPQTKPENRPNTIPDNRSFRPPESRSQPQTIPENRPNTIPDNRSFRPPESRPNSLRPQLIPDRRPSIFLDSRSNPQLVPNAFRQPSLPSTSTPRNRFGTTSIKVVTSTESYNYEYEYDYEDPARRRKRDIEE